MGWKKGPLGTCEECSPTKTGAVNPLFLIPFAIVIAYVIIRRASALHRESRLQELGRARRMFEDMDTDKSGTITTDEMQRNLSVLGLDVDEDTTALLVESIDRDHSGDIDVHEFSAWMGKLPRYRCHLGCILLKIETTVADRHDAQGLLGEADHGGG